jgi:hypothetical protein
MRPELGRVLHQGLHGAGGQLGKGGIIRRKDREGTRALQRFHQSGGLDGGDQGRETFGADGDIDNGRHREVWDLRFWILASEGTRNPVS